MLVAMTGCLMGANVMQNRVSVCLQPPKHNVTPCNLQHISTSQDGRLGTEARLTVMLLAEYIPSVLICNILMCKDTNAQANRSYVMIQMFKKHVICKYKNCPC